MEIMVGFWSLVRCASEQVRLALLLILLQPVVLLWKEIKRHLSFITRWIHSPMQIPEARNGSLFVD